MKSNSLQIGTPEGVVFSHVIASPYTRFLAWLMDFIVVASIALFFQRFAAIMALVSEDFAQALAILIYFCVWFGYGILLETYWNGQTLGKKLLRLRVIDAGGLPLAPSQLVLRNLLRAVDMLPFFYVVGGITALCSAKGQRLGDIAANTVVISLPHLPQPDLQQIRSSKYNSLRDHPHLQGRLRQRLPAHDAHIFLEAILRRDEFEPEGRIRCYAALAQHIKDKVQLPPELIDTQTDEQLLRNVVEILFTRHGQRESASTSH